MQYTIAFYPVFTITHNLSSIEMLIDATLDLLKAMQTPLPKSPFQVGDSQLKVMK